MLREHPLSSVEGLASLRPSVSKKVSSGWPRYEADEIAAVADVLRSGRVNALVHGDETTAFQAEFAAFAQRRHGIALANGTVALELALEVLGIGPGDEVIVTARSFVASAACVSRLGAMPVFADIDAESQNITPATVAPHIGPRTKAIIAVHLAGWPCDLEGLAALAAGHRLALIEDCAQAHGATWQGRPVGSFGRMAVFSFCTDKIISTGGEGGMLVLDDDDLHAHAWSIKDHGKDLATLRRPQEAPGFRYLHHRIGTNWRMTEMQAAIGRRQLAKLPAWIARRRANVARLTAGLRRLPGLRLTTPPPEAGLAYYKYYAFVRPDRLAAGWNRDRILAEIVACGVPCFSGSCPEIYRERAFEGAQPRTELPIARELGETSLMFLVDHTLDGADMAAVVAATNAAMARATHKMWLTGDELFAAE